MSTDTLHPLTTEGTRLTVQNPTLRYDKQGETTDGVRAEAPLRGFVHEFGATAAVFLESCIHCGQCAEACHYYVQTGDAKYTPIRKLEPFKQAYKREMSPFALFYRAFNLKRKVTAAELETWQELIYDSCTLCGRCSLICPMGIDIASLIGQARHGMFEAGLVPHELWAVAERAKREGSPLGATPKIFQERCEWLADEHDVAIHVNLDRADILVSMSSIEIMKYPESIVATAKVLNHLGASWTFRTDGYEATNFGMLSGNTDWQKEASLKLIHAAIACGAHLLILPECGHAYGALRWQGANMFGKPLPFEVLHISEFLSQQVRKGGLRLKPLNSTVTFHDPCQVSRRGGATQAPRDVLQALGADLHETEMHGDLNWCCGGGGGVVTIHRADALRYKVFQLKMRQVDDTGAQMLVSSCSNCRQTFDDGQAHFHWDKTMLSLLELVADNLITPPQTAVIKQGDAA